MNNQRKVAMLECNDNALQDLIEQFEGLMDLPKGEWVIELHWNTANDICSELEEIQRVNSNVLEHIYRKRLYA